MRGLCPDLARAQGLSHDFSAGCDKLICKTKSWKNSSMESGKQHQNSLGWAGIVQTWSVPPSIFNKEKVIHRLIFSDNLEN